MTEVPSLDAPSRILEVRFAPTIVLSKAEAFEACEACAEAERALVNSGLLSQAERLAELFAVIEERLAHDSQDAGGRQRESESAGSKSRDKEFTQ